MGSSTLSGDAAVSPPLVAVGWCIKVGEAASIDALSAGAEAFLGGVLNIAGASSFSACSTGG